MDVLHASLYSPGGIGFHPNWWVSLCEWFWINDPNHNTPSLFYVDSGAFWLVLWVEVLLTITLTNFAFSYILSFSSYLKTLF